AQGILKLTERTTRLALETSGQLRQQREAEQVPWEAPRREGEEREGELEREVEQALKERAGSN
ncbi:MAG TPA: hypothetical protein VEU33_04745, partial [Archangium sp.]|nr:hypothetical protein [Archangium sp.]